MAAAIINIVVDFVLILLPLPTVWSLWLPLRQKCALSAVFMLGFLLADPLSHPLSPFIHYLKANYAASVLSASLASTSLTS
jgi:hypothetical protein